MQSIRVIILNSPFSWSTWNEGSPLLDQVPWDLQWCFSAPLDWEKLSFKQELKISPGIIADIYFKDFHLVF